MKNKEIIRILMKKKFMNNHRSNQEEEKDSQNIDMGVSREGYVNIRVKIELNKFGKEKDITFVSVPQNDPHSICLFIAGGVEIDKKVEEANAQLAIENIK